MIWDICCNKSVKSVLEYCPCPVGQVGSLANAWIRRVKSSARGSFYVSQRKDMNGENKRKPTNVPDNRMPRTLH